MTYTRFSSLILGLAGLTCSLFSAESKADDPLFSNSFEVAFDLPTSDAEAVRFLNQATFGARPQDIPIVRSQSVSGWLNGQLNHPTVTLSRAWLEAYAAALPANSSVNQDARLHRWFDVAVTAPDQVRQKVAYALSQIVVASDRDDFLAGEPIQMAEWNDILVRNALGNYRTLLREVTYSPMMGRYLTHLRNRKFELVRSTSGGNTTFTAGNNGVQPDENYAREIMQLFSIGLVVRGDDFYTTFADPQNPQVLQTTYDEDDISELARFFTGLSYQCTQGVSVVGGVPLERNCGSNSTTACTGIGCRFGNGGNRLFGNSPPRDPLNRGLIHPDWYRPLVCYPRYHDNGRDTSGAIIETDTGSFSLPPGTPTPEKTLTLGSSQGVRTLTVQPSFLDGSPLNCHASNLNEAQQQACIDYCEGSIDAVVDLLFNHPNTPPMVARQLIQRLVTSNPSPAYVRRVAEVFANNGNNVRGDMKAVVRAILIDEEARRPHGAAGQPVDFGKVREPMLKLVALWRHFGAVSGDTALFPNQNPQGSPATANPLAGQPALRRWGPTNPQNEYQQRPLGAPTVFNFFEPDYRQPGTVTERGLFSPELQIIHEVTSVAAANDLFARLCSGYGGNSNNCGSGALTGGPTSPTPPDANNNPPNSRAYFPIAQIDQIPARVAERSTAAEPAVADDLALIEFFNVRLMGGTMSGSVPADFSCSNTGTGMKSVLMKAMRCSATWNNATVASINTALNGGTNGTSNGNQQQRQRRKALYLMHLIAISPEYSTQR
ncbi:DUF1800 domain-containing protein [Aquimonas voraii]|uniref:DUF1800 domain-containing protein n=1 Tax=Aquimonas voraii TaxID=265719 RepID=A0A1G6XZ97_9GAMM|nr:DUF1800 family protein [Aquimonas voraii]SDD83390.1 Protein of unknown function [Aquimonas voraii]